MMNLKNIISVILVSFMFVACNNKETDKNKEEDKYKVDNYIKNEDIEKNLLPILPYVTKLEDGVTYDNRFDEANKAYFLRRQGDYKFSFERYFITPDSTHYFLLWKIAPSIYEKKIAIGGRYKKDSSGKIYAFEELFNTPKMKIDELKPKSFELFDYMVKNGNVDKFVGDYLLIEFPDANCVYDKEKSRWIVKGQLKVLDSLNAAKKEDSNQVK